MQAFFVFSGGMNGREENGHILNIKELFLQICYLITQLFISH